MKHALSTLLFNFSFVYAVRKVPEDQNGSELNGTHQFKFCTCVLYWGEDVDTM